MAGGAVAVPAPGIALPRQRPARPAVKPRRAPTRKTTRAPQQGGPGIALRAIDAIAGISSSVVLDRLIRGRAWIGLIAFALIGIVAMQLLVLELNTGIGRTLRRVATLQRENAQLDIEDSMYSAEGRIAPLAAAAGMTLAPAGTIHFLAASPPDVSRAASSLSTPLQTPASGVSGSVGAPGSEASSSSASNPSSNALAGEGASSTASSHSGAGESGAGSGEPASSSSAGSGTSVPGSVPTVPTAPTTPATAATTSSSGGSQATGASVAAAGGSAAAGEASGSGGVTQAGPRE